MYNRIYSNGKAMDAEEILKFADNLVFAKTGKHLSNVQEAILQGAWQGRKYLEIAEEVYCSESHVRDVASELWKILSNVLGEAVNKSNLKSTFKRLHVSIISSTVEKNSVQIGNFNVCSEAPHSSEVSKNRSPSTSENTQPQFREDLRDAPEIKTFYDRPSFPLTTLETLITEQDCRLLTITGMSGIGKSAIVRHLIPLVANQFDRIIWRSLRTSPSLETTLKNLIQFISEQTDIDFPININEQLSLLIELLRKYRCLIILDDVQCILNSGQIAGNYKPGYENYGTLFKLMGEIPHCSCLILNSWEPPIDILTFTEDNSAVRLLQL